MTQLSLQTELGETNHSHFTHRSYRDEHNKSTSRKIKVVIGTADAIETFCIQVRNRPEIF